MSLRLPLGLDAAKHLDAQPGILQFDDGSQKTLGAFMCWLGLIAVSKDFNKEDFHHHSLQLLIKSLLNIATVFKEPTSFVGDPLDSLVARVVKQNSDAKVQPISSFQWAVLLQSLRASSDGDQPITLDEALKRYNEHPEVVAQGGKLTVPHPNVVYFSFSLRTSLTRQANLKLSTELNGKVPSQRRFPKTNSRFQENQLSIHLQKGPAFRSKNTGLRFKATLVDCFKLVFDNI